MKKEVEYNRYFRETDADLSEITIHNEFGYGVFLLGDRVEDWNLGHFNNIETKNALRFDASVAAEFTKSTLQNKAELYVQKFDESANLTGVSLDSPNSLLAVKENADIEPSNSFYLDGDKKLIVD